MASAQALVQILVKRGGHPYVERRWQSDCPNLSKAPTRALSEPGHSLERGELHSLLGFSRYPAMDQLGLVEPVDGLDSPLWVRCRLSGSAKRLQSALSRLLSSRVCSGCCC